MAAFTCCRFSDARDVVDAPPEDVLLEAMHVRDADGRWSHAGAAWIRIAREIRVLRPLAIAARLAPIRSLVEWTYWRVSDNRDRLSHVLGDAACDVKPRRSDRSAIRAT